MTKVIRSVDALRWAVSFFRQEGAGFVGVVPTMGALHEGHLSLAWQARQECGCVIATIFINPQQFDNKDDFMKYPRSEAEDLALLSSIPVDFVFIPSPEEIYPDGYGTMVSVGGLSSRLEGIKRPGHFDGVTTIVTKLLGISGADRAYFGEKDWQQLQVIRKLAKDLNFSTEITGCPTFREPDGLAMSSRNRRLSGDARQIAPVLYREMCRLADGFSRDHIAKVEIENALKEVRKALISVGFDAVDYIELCDEETLLPVGGSHFELGQKSALRLFAAVWLKGVRLIDNISMS